MRANLLAMPRLALRRERALFARYSRSARGSRLKGPPMRNNGYDSQSPPDRRPACQVWDVMATGRGMVVPQAMARQVRQARERPGGVSMVTRYGPEGEVNPKRHVLALTDGQTITRRFAMTDAISPLGQAVYAGIWTIEPKGRNRPPPLPALSEETMTSRRNASSKDGVACADQPRRFEAPGRRSTAMKGCTCRKVRYRLSPNDVACATDAGPARKRPQICA